MKVYTTPEIKVTYFVSDEVLTDATPAPGLFDDLSAMTAVGSGENEKTIQKVAGIQFAE